MRFNWVHVRLAAIDADEMRDLLEGAWAMCVPSASPRSTRRRRVTGRMLRHCGDG
jgi:hypothetical protein